jgi:hypothetical protein
MLYVPEHESGKHAMKIHWTDLELEEFWSLTNVERQELLPGKTQSHRLAVAALLKFYQIAGCFPGNLRELPERVVLHLARTLDIDVSVSPSSIYALSTRASERHRAEIRRFLGIRQASVADQKRARQWLIDRVITGEQTTVELLDHVQDWFHKQGLEPPSRSSQHRVIRKARHGFDQKCFQDIAGALPESSRRGLDALLSPGNEGPEEPGTGFHTLKSDPARLKTFKGHLVDQICQASGGPCKYMGKDMKAAHMGMGVSGPDFDALVEDLVGALDKFKVGTHEKEQLLGALGPMKTDIVEKK